MNKIKKIFLELAGFLLASLLVFALLSLLISPAENKLSKHSQRQVKTLYYVAIGDSLTEGVGDATSQGGFVPLLAQNIQNGSNVSVDFQNFGHAGDTSTQIYEKIKQKQIQSALKEADFITLTVGGNDVMKVVRDNASHLSDLTVSDFTKPSQSYQKQIQMIFDNIRKVNKKAHIYVLGIYNPFYLNFPQITALQEIIDNWNKATEKVVQEQENISFVPINDLLYKGIDGKQGISETESDSANVSNDLLFTGDHFHPNNIGYQIMANAVFEKYQQVNN